MQIQCALILSALTSTGNTATGLGFWGLGLGVWGFGFGVWGLGFWVWGLGFRVLGLGFGVWGLQGVPILIVEIFIADLRTGRRADYNKASFTL